MTGKYKEKIDVAKSNIIIVQKLCDFILEPTERTKKILLETTLQIAEFFHVPINKNSIQFTATDIKDYLEVFVTLHKGFQGLLPGFYYFIKTYEI